jgi:multidrug efflux system membrane fusion protein
VVEEAMQHKHLFALGVCFLLAATSGCKWEPSKQVADKETPALPVSHPLERKVTDYVDFTGQTAAVQSVDVRPRVTGYILDMPFTEGEEVPAGKLLFRLDPEVFKDQLDQAENQVKLNAAALELARTTYERDRRVANTTQGGVSLQQLAEDRAAVQTADARLRASEASRNTFRLNLEYTEIRAPIDGQVGRYYLTKGNLVTAYQTVLTTIVSLDPMHVYFDLDEPTLLRIRKAINEGKLRPTREGKTPVFMGLQGEEGSPDKGEGVEGYPHKGFINFLNNQVNAGTGSIAMRGVFANPLPSHGERLLSPGMFVRVRLPIGEPHVAFVVIDRAIVSDQGLKYVYVLDSENKAQYRRIATGALEPDGMRVVTDGLKADDWVIVGGLQQVRPKMVIRADRTTMPTLARSNTAQDQASPAGKDVKESSPNREKPKQ